jgi:transcriptional regulator with XRE-family HTH domain
VPEFGAFLREKRRRIHPETSALGAHLRLPSRIGKRVTQEELAETVGVSRVWYAQLETGVSRRVSAELLARLADALLLDEDERTALFHLGIPDLTRGTLLPSSAALLDAYAWVRDCAKRLYTATSEREALDIATEQVAQRFEGSMVYNGYRRPDGTWDTPMMLGDPATKARLTECIDALAQTLGPRGMTELRCYPLLSQPGEVCSEEVLPAMSIRKRYAPLVAAYDFERWSLLYGRVRSRTDFVAGITVRHPTDRYAPEQHALMSTITDLTSLVLS